jgi:hypothetical protein
MTTHPPVTKRQAFNDLRLTECACGARKGCMMSHCRACYFKLPKPMRQALYSTHDDYVTPYNNSLQFLGLESPSAREDRIRDAAIREGIQISIKEVQLRQPTVNQDPLTCQIPIASV